jgi:protein SCO1/2
MRTRTAFPLVLALLAGACGGSSSGQREYKLQGQVLSIASDRKEANIRHEEIPGFMAAMTMPYRVRDAKEYEALAPGDLINATLIVTDRDGYLTEVKKVGSAPLEKAPGEAGAPSALNLLPAGAPVPEGEFVNESGEKVSLATYRGSALVVTFMYSTCPMPDFCPLMDRNFAALQQKLLEDRNELRVRLLSVTIDPQVDTPQVLRAHAKTLGADPRIWSFLSGDRDKIDEWSSHLGLSVSRAINDPRDITHNLRTVLIDRHGNLVTTYPGNAWKPEQVLADIKVMVGVD